ncbi:MAG: hypothetical protein ACI9E9_002006 [Reinekea sp.]|jgi:hypothetical protein
MALYVPNVANSTELHRAMGVLRAYLKGQVNIALSIEPYVEIDKARIAITVIGFQKTDVEQESERLIEWIERTVDGQTLATECVWL